MQNDCYWNRFGKCHILAVRDCPKKCGWHETPEAFRKRQEKFEKKHGRSDTK